MNWFWQRRTRHKAIEKVPPPSMEMIRRVEITVEEDWISGVIPRPAENPSEAAGDGEQRIDSRPKLPASTEGDSRVK